MRDRLRKVLGEKWLPASHLGKGPLLADTPSKAWSYFRQLLYVDQNKKKTFVLPYLSDFIHTFSESCVFCAQYLVVGGGPLSFPFPPTLSATRQSNND